MLSVKQLVAKYPNDRYASSATVAQLRKELAGHMVVTGTTKQQLLAKLAEMRAATPEEQDEMEVRATESVASREEFINELCLLEPEEVVAQLQARGYAAKTQKKYLEFLGKAGYGKMSELRVLLHDVVVLSKQQDMANLAERHKNLANSGDMEEWAKKCFRHAKEVLANPVNPWDVALSLQLVTGRRYSEIGRMVVANGMFMGKGKGRDGMYDGVWFPMFSFVSEPVLQRALAIVQKECGPADTEAQRVKWNKRLVQALETWPTAPSEVTPKVFRKVYAKVASVLPNQFPMPVEWARYSTAARVAWLCGHGEEDLATQNSYELFNCTATTAKAILLSMSKLA